MYDIKYADDAFARKKIGNSIVDLDKKLLSQLKNAGIIYAFDFLARSKTKELRKVLSADTGIDYATILYLTKCCDLLRLLGVSKKTLHYLYETGYDCVRNIKGENPVEVAGKVRLYMKSIGLKSGMPPCCSIEEVVKLAKIMPEVIEDFD